MPKWTDAQKHAIYASDSNILVSAAAGSGKTAVLVQRVIEKITNENNNTNVDELLIVTFTIAAAREMKSRIAKALNDIIREHPNDTNAIKQLSLLPNAQISTIDSFCSNLVREHFFMLDIQQDFTILDNAKALLVEDSAIETVINELYENDDESFRTLVELLSSTKNDKEFINVVKRLNNFVQAQDFPYEWLDKLCDFYDPNVDLDDSFWGNYLKSSCNELLDFVFSLLNDCDSMLTPEDDLYDELSSILSSDRNLFEKLRNTNNIDDLVDLVKNFKFVSMTSKKRNFTAKEEIYELRKAYQGIFKDDIKPLFNAKSDEFKFDNECLYNNVKLLSEIVKRYNDEMMKLKKELNAYTFSDVMHFALELICFKDDNGDICRTELAKEYEGAYKEILVDEYQDTNSAQDTLFEMLSNGKNRFMVGDVKQSIYRFRLAMPQIFTNKKNCFDPYGTENSVNQRIILDQNFRSRKGICDYTNFIFSNIMSNEVGELDYNQDEYLNLGAKYRETDIPSAQIKIVKAPENADIDEYEAHQVAKLILKKIASKEQIKDGDEYRDICFGDFAILFRYASTRMPIFNKVLAEYGIPVVANNKSNLFESNEINILISLLRVIDNPSQDIPLLATLMSVFYGYSADDIARAKVKTKSQNLYGSISNDAQFSQFICDLDKYRSYASSMNVESFLRQIIADTSFLSIISAMGNAEQRKLNVMKLIDISKGFDNGENVGITAFVRYIDSIMSSQLSVDSASVAGDSKNAVSLTTIHGSKGLEYPVCIFVGTNHKYNDKDKKSLVQLNSECGIGMKVHIEEQLYRYNSVQFDCIKRINAVSEMSENLRVLYVAVTRAKEQFITFYTDECPEKHINSISSKIYGSVIPSFYVKHITKDCDIFLLTALLHKDGSILRDFCDKAITPNLNFNFDLDVEMLCDETEVENEAVTAVFPNESLVKEIEDKLSFSYERKELSGFSSKRTASSLDERTRGLKYLASSKPAFLNKSGLTSAEKGTAMHNFMQYCDYDKAKQDIEREISRLVNDDMISIQQADSLDRKKLTNLFNSKLAYRMLNADNIYREIKVSTFVPVNELEDTDYTDLVLVQGIADCVFEENGELVLVDYKTDRVDNEEELLNLYEKQIGFYRNAVSKTLEKPVKEAMLYSFSINKECIYK